MTATPIKRRKFFDCRPSTDGCDETFEVISRKTGYRVAWTGYWEAKIPARRSALIMTKALNIIFAGYGINFCLTALAKEQQKIAFVWDIEHVRYIRYDLTDEQAWQVLQAVDSQYDPKIGVNWETIRVTAKTLFGEKPD